MFKTITTLCCGILMFYLMITIARSEAPKSETSKKFIGTWSLQSFTAILPDGKTVYPFGEDAVGRIVYDRQGRMMVQFMRQNRPAFASGDHSAGTPEEIAAAFSGFMAYYGRYQVDEKEGTVTHSIEVCSFPNWVGSSQVRYFTFRGDLLTLRTPPIQRGSVWKAPTPMVVVWKKEK
jgi:hypothetical protein